MGCFAYGGYPRKIADKVPRRLNCEAKKAWA